MFDKDLDGVCEYDYLLPIENNDINSIFEKLFINSSFEHYFSNNEFLDLFKNVNENYLISKLNELKAKEIIDNRMFNTILFFNLLLDMNNLLMSNKNNFNGFSQFDKDKVYNNYAFILEDCLNELKNKIGIDKFKIFFNELNNDEFKENIKNMVYNKEFYHSINFLNKFTFEIFFQNIEYLFYMENDEIINNGNKLLEINDLFSEFIDTQDIVVSKYFLDKFENILSTSKNLNFSLHNPIINYKENLIFGEETDTYYSFKFQSINNLLRSFDANPNFLYFHNKEIFKILIKNIENIDGVDLTNYIINNHHLEFIKKSNKENYIINILKNDILKNENFINKNDFLKDDYDIKHLFILNNVLNQKVLYDVYDVDDVEEIEMISNIKNDKKLKDIVNGYFSKKTSPYINYPNHILYLIKNDALYKNNIQKIKETNRANKYIYDNLALNNLKELLLFYPTNFSILLDEFIDERLLSFFIDEKIKNNYDFNTKLNITFTDIEERHGDGFLSVKYSHYKYLKEDNDSENSLISLILFSVEINPNYKDKSFLLNNPNFLKLITEDVILDTLNLINKHYMNQLDIKNEVMEFLSNYIFLINDIDAVINKYNIDYGMLFENIDKFNKIGNQFRINNYDSNYINKIDELKLKIYNKFNLNTNKAKNRIKV